ncbi:MAG: transposase [Bacilli bacterium]
MARDYELSMYKEFEKLNNKIDKLLETNKEQSLTIYSLRLEIRNLNKKLDEKDKTIKKLEQEIDKLRNKNNKNSSNSSRPSSTDIVKPKGKTGANIYNSREKTNKKPGGQFGHKGSNLDKAKIEKLIQDKKIKVVDRIHYIKTKNKEEIVKYKVGLNVIPFVERHIFKHDENSKETLPKEYYTDVVYHNSIKALSIHLGAYNVISYDRLSEFFEVISNGIIKISNGSLVNFLKEFSVKANNSLINLENHLLNQNDILTDETSSKLNGKNMHVRNYSCMDTVIYKAHKNKGHKPIKEDDILTRFTGGIMGDHDTTLYSYGTRNYECNAHVKRYLEELIQNIKNIQWPRLMQELLTKMYKTKEIIKKYGITQFSKEQVTEYERSYDEILYLAEKENKEIKSTYYKDKAENLRKRMKKYKKNHLYFIKDFKVMYDNNMSERDLRFFKRKTKISGGFRNLDFAKYYVDTLSIIKTSIKREINPYVIINDVLANKIVFS